MVRKISGVILILLLTAAAVSAQQLYIEDVDIKVKGLSQKQLLARKMGFELEKQFESYEQLEKYVADRKQVLINMRVFDAVESEILDGSTPESYKVIIFVDDAFTTLPIPYGKYDSNYGLKLGFKLFDTNLLGTLSNVKLTTFAAQTDSAPNSWEEKDIFNELIWNNIPLFGSNLNSKTTLTFNHNAEQGFYDGHFETALTLTDLPLFSKNFSMKANIEADQLENDLEFTWDKPVYDIALTWARLPFAGKNVTIGAKWDLDKWDAATGNGVYDVNLDATFHRLDMLINEFDLLMGIEYHFEGRDLPKSLSNMYFGVRDSISLPLSSKLTSTAKISADPTDILDADLEFINTWTIPLPMSFRYTTTADYTFKPLNEDTTKFEWTNKLTRNRINWQHNFRSGLKLNAASTVYYDVTDMFAAYTMTSSYNSISATSFINLAGLMNLGGRLTAYYAHDTAKYFMDSSSNKPAELMRGILDKNIENTTRSFGGVLNTNAVITFIDVSFAELLAAVFVDVGVFSTEQSFENIEYHISGGVEGTLIFDKFKSYPFNVTIGADLMDVRAYMNDELESIWDIEYEILMSLELFY